MPVGSDAWITLVRGATGARAISACTRVQSLWGGYGELVRVTLEGAEVPSVVVKHARPPRDATPSVSDARKRRSYEVEGNFYRTFAAAAPARARVPALLASHREDDAWVLVLEDLDAAGFAGRRSAPRGEALEACLRWLASFHAAFLGEAPVGLWAEGTYWHLATRREELTRTTDPRLRARAPTLDHALATARHRTFVHGDAKPANFCFSGDGRRVAAVDFQYVGGGVGVRDVAYLLHGEHQETQEAALTTYFAALAPSLPPTLADAVEAEWRALYPVAVEDFERFLSGWNR